jgi:thiol-disulfide isomerase/thioredoxin
LLTFVETFAQTPVPLLELTDVQGRKLRLEDYRGKVVLINFWATWCPPCRTEVPQLIKWQRDYGKQGLQIIGITYPPQTRAQVTDFARKTRMNYPVALGTAPIKTLFTSTEALPVTVVIDTTGNVRDVIEGIVFPDELDAKIKPLLTKQLSAASPPAQSKPRIQKATIVVDAEGYRPRGLKLRRGVPTRLTFIRKVAEGCGTEIVIPAYGISRPLPLKVPVVVSFTPNRSGRVKLTCGMDMFRGWLIVR